MGEDIDVLYNFIHSGPPDHRAWCNEHVRDKEMKEGVDRVTGDYNTFWAGRDYLNDMKPMKAALLMTLIALAALAVAYLQYQEAASLRGSLARSEEARLALQAQVDANTTQQANVQQQIQQLQDNLRSSSQQLLQLSNSLQEAREMLVPPTPAP